LRGQSGRIKDESHDVGVGVSGHGCEGLSLLRELVNDDGVVVGGFLHDDIIPEIGLSGNGRHGDLFSGSRDAANSLRQYADFVEETHEEEEKLMGWMRTLFMGDIGQNLELEELRQRLDRMRDETPTGVLTQGKQVAALKDEVHDLKVRLAAMIRLLVAKNILTAEEIASMITVLEPEDPK
jgi:hypothetical protein